MLEFESKYQFHDLAGVPKTLEKRLCLTQCFIRLSGVQNSMSKKGSFWTCNIFLLDANLLYKQNAKSSVNKPPFRDFCLSLIGRKREIY